jgi:hypothetical protein
MKWLRVSSRIGNNMGKKLRPRNPTMDALVKRIATSPAFEFENVCKSFADAVEKSKQPNAVTLAAMQEADDIINGAIPYTGQNSVDDLFKN